MKAHKIKAETGVHAPMMRFFASELKTLVALEGLRASEAMRLFINWAASDLRLALFSRIGDAARADKARSEIDAALGRLRSPMSQKRLTQMADQVAAALAAEPVDFLGPAFMHLLANDHQGQFFTPTDVSKTIAALTLPRSPAEAPLEKGYISLCEPTCGVGGMVLAAQEVLRHNGFDPATQTRWHMTEIDRVAVDAAYIQTSLAKVPALVHWGDTLRLQVFDAWPTPQLVAVCAEPPAQLAAAE